MASYRYRYTFDPTFDPASMHSLQARYPDLATVQALLRCLSGTDLVLLDEPRTLPNLPVLVQPDVRDRILKLDIRELSSAGKPGRRLLPGSKLACAAIQNWLMRAGYFLAHGVWPHSDADAKCLEAAVQRFSDACATERLQQMWKHRAQAADPELGVSVEQALSGHPFIALAGIVDPDATINWNDPLGEGWGTTNVERIRRLPMNSIRTDGGGYPLVAAAERRAKAAQDAQVSFAAKVSRGLREQTLAERAEASDEVHELRAQLARATVKADELRRRLAAAEGELAHALAR